MRPYQNRNFGNFDEFLADVPNNPDRKNMKKELSPLVLELQKNNIQSPQNFVEIMMRYNLSRKVIADFINNNGINEISLPTRIVNHSNAFEKNTIFTYYFFVSREQMMNKFKGYVTDKYPCFHNKDSLFNAIEKEIDKISNAIDDSSGQSNTGSDTYIDESLSSDHFIIQDDEGEENYLGGFDWDMPDIEEEVFGISYIQYI